MYFELPLAISSIVLLFYRILFENGNSELQITSRSQLLFCLKMVTLLFVIEFHFCSVFSKISLQPHAYAMDAAISHK